MLTELRIHNFKRFREAVIELAQPVVFVGPNNSGKTTALQALWLWSYGIRWWASSREDSKAKSRTGVALNRRDLLAIPLPRANLLWRDQQTMRRNRNVLVEIGVSGSNGSAWACDLEFRHANAESVYCKLNTPDADGRLLPPEGAIRTNVAYLPPMSGLNPNEVVLERGAVNVRIGEGRTAEVLRNLCRELVVSHPDRWAYVTGRIEKLFGVTLEEPEYIPERGELTLGYREQGKRALDISAAGRGIQQTLLLLAWLKLNPETVLLLDEPDAHLEVLRQRRIVDELAEAASGQSSQLIIASHSEAVMNHMLSREEARIVAFIGPPHSPPKDKLGHLSRALSEYGFEHYLHIERQGWVLYTEGATDHLCLREFARLLDHPAREHLETPFTFLLGGNDTGPAKKHLSAMREAKADALGFLLVDHDAEDGVKDVPPGITPHAWHRREIENYVFTPESLKRYAASFAPAVEADSQRALFPAPKADELRELMERAIASQITSDNLADAEFWKTTKFSEGILKKVLTRFHDLAKLGSAPNKGGFHTLVEYLLPTEVDPEVVLVLDMIVDVASRAQPLTDEDDDADE